jgi:hypothetical protein
MMTEDHDRSVMSDGCTTSRSEVTHIIVLNLEANNLATGGGSEVRRAMCEYNVVSVVN